MKILKTKRLLISAMSVDELRSDVLSENDESKKSDLHEILQSCLDHPDKHNWYTNWKIALHDGKVIGNLGFKGPQKNGAVEIACAIYEEHRNNGFATEAVRQAIHWAFSDNDVYFITAETEESDLASKHVLEKLGFAPNGAGNKGELYEKEREESSWMAIFMCIGISCGVSIGITLDNVGTGMCIGMCLGVAVGLSFDESDRKKRIKLREARDSR